MKMATSDYEKKLFLDYEKKLFSMREANAIMGETIKSQDKTISSLRGELAIMQAIFATLKQQVEELKEELERRNSDGAEQKNAEN